MLLIPGVALLIGGLFYWRSARWVADKAIEGHRKASNARRALNRILSFGFVESRDTYATAARISGLMMMLIGAAVLIVTFVT